MKRFRDRNIFAIRKDKTNTKAPKLDKNFTLAFHSRRTQHSFSEWLGFKAKHYWGNKPEILHLKFQQYLERTELKYILDF